MPSLLPDLVLNMSNGTGWAEGMQQDYNEYAVLPKCGNEMQMTKKKTKRTMKSSSDYFTGGHLLSFCLLHGNAIF